MTAPLPIAAMISRRRDAAEPHADRLLDSFVREQQAAGWHIGGLLQEACPGNGACAYRLRDLQNGDYYLISQDLGPHSTACRIDLGALADAAQVMRRLADNRADLAVFNRFAKLEAYGRGFASEMLALMQTDMAVLTIVPEEYLPAWREFTGGLAAELEAEPAALADWFAGVTAGRRPAAGPATCDTGCAG